MALEAVSDPNELNKINLVPIINDLFSERTLLYEACYKGYIESVKLLLNVKGIDVNKGLKQHNGWYNCNRATPLYEACGKGYLEIVKLLLNVKGIDVNKGKDYEHHNSPLHKACKKGHLEIVKLLLNAKGIDVNKGWASVNYYHWTSPLFTAYKKGHLEIVKLLLNSKDIDVNKGDDYVTILYEACRKEHLEMVKLLLNTKGIDVFKGKFRPLTKAVENAHKYKNFEIVKLLISKIDYFQYKSQIQKMSINKNTIYDWIFYNTIETSFFPGKTTKELIIRYSLLFIIIYNITKTNENQTNTKLWITDKCIAVEWIHFIISNIESFIGFDEKSLFSGLDLYNIVNYFNNNYAFNWSDVFSIDILDDLLAACLKEIRDQTDYLTPYLEQRSDVTVNLVLDNEHRFLLLNQIGMGATARVYKGYDLNLNRWIAIKLFTVSGALEEFKSSQQLFHENITPIYQHGYYKQLEYLILPLANYSLSKKIQEIHQDEIQDKKLLNWCLQMTSGLLAIHNSGFIHRDIKPDNCLVFEHEHEENREILKLTDLGFAKKFDITKNSIFTVQIGTFAYMAPELGSYDEDVINKENIDIDQAVDIYSLGLTFFKIFTNHNLRVKTCFIYEMLKAGKELEVYTLICTTLNQCGMTNTILQRLIITMIHIVPGKRLKCENVLRILRCIVEDKSFDNKLLTLLEELPTNSIQQETIQLLEKQNQELVEKLEKSEKENEIVKKEVEHLKRIIAELEKRIKE